LQGLEIEEKKDVKESEEKEKKPILVGGYVWKEFVC
jgi:hypothetical protein